MTEQNKRQALVVGASRGLGRGVALELARRHWSVLGVARTEAPLRELSSSGIQHRVGDATDATLAADLMAGAPDAVILAAGAMPTMASLVEQTWESFFRPFEMDLRAAFVWLRAALKANRPPRRVVVFSSAAALNGSPLSGGYAGAKQAQRFLCDYARSEAQARGLPMRVHCLLPQLNPNTDLGAVAVAAYAKRAGETPEEFVKKRFGDALDPSKAGLAVAELLDTDMHAESSELILSGRGLSSLP